MARPLTRRERSRGRGAMVLAVAAILTACDASEPPPGAYELQTVSDAGSPAQLAQRFGVRLLLEEDGGYLLTVRDDFGVETRSAGIYMLGGNRLALCDSLRCRTARLDYTYARSILTLTLSEAEARRIGEVPFRWGLKRR